MSTYTDLINRFIACRRLSEVICEPLEVEDCVLQPIPDVSPPKWHLAHSSWFFEQFVLVPHAKKYALFHPDFAYLFNSYYNNVGKRVLRPQRGCMSRPPLREVLRYRTYITSAVTRLLEQSLDSSVLDIIELGIQHEQQHQELLIYDIKYILGTQALMPAYGPGFEPTLLHHTQSYVEMSAHQYEIGALKGGFSFDNEHGRHRVFLEDFEISRTLVTNREYLEFVRAGGYADFNLWLSDGWEIVKSQGWKAPLYWHCVDGSWCEYTLEGLMPLDLEVPVRHVSFYEASAFAAWSGKRLATEFEWEAASSFFEWGQLWEWTNSAYLPYPGFTKAVGALGEYNGKFMVNQHVLRGASSATPPGHSRATYRNFFHPSSRWMFSGIRLAK